MPHRSPMADAPRRSVALLLAATILACTDAPRPLTAPASPPPAPRADLTLADVCAETGENIYTGTGWQPTQSGCATALASGFADQSTTWQFDIPDDLRYKMHWSDATQYVWATYEVRLPASGAQTQRLVRVDWVPGNLDVHVPPFTVHLLPQLAGLKLVAFLGGCSGASTPEQCWTLARQAPTHLHWEMRYCVDNPADVLWPRATEMAPCIEGETTPYWQNASPDAVITLGTPTPGGSTGGGSIPVSGAASSDPEGGPLGFAWKLVDAAGVVVRIASGIAPTFADVAAGTYTVRLDLSDGGDGFDIAEAAVTVPTGNGAPVAVVDVTSIQAATQSAGGSLSVSAARSTDPDDDPLTFAWQLKQGGTVLATATGSTATFAGLAAGTYTAVVVATDPGNLTGTASASATVSYVEVPTVTISGPSTARANFTCQWTATASGGTPGYAYAWFRRNAGATKFTKVASGDSYVASTGTGSFTLRASVTDAAGTVGQSADFPVTVTSSAPACLTPDGP